MLREVGFPPYPVMAESHSAAGVVLDMGKCSLFSLLLSA